MGNVVDPIGYSVADLLGHDLEQPAGGSVGDPSVLRRIDGPATDLYEVSGDVWPGVANASWRAVDSWINGIDSQTKDAMLAVARGRREQLALAMLTMAVKERTQCSSAVRIQRDAHVGCVRNTVGWEPGTVAVLSVVPSAPAGTAFSISGLSLDYNQLGVQFGASVKSFAVRVDGGSYAQSDEPVLGGTGKARLGLSPRCEQRRVAISGQNSGASVSGTLTAPNLGDRGVSLAPQLVGSEILLDVPRAVGRNRLELALGPYSYVATWDGPTVPKDIELLSAKFQVAWKKHCLYPSDEDCPTLTFPELDSGFCVSMKTQDECVYTCDVSERHATGVRFPLLARFTPPSSFGGSDNTWDDRIVSPGAHSSAYPPVGNRLVAIDWSEWPKDRVTNKLDPQPIEINWHGDQTFLVNERTEFLRLPFGCGDSTTFAAFGDRGFYSGHAKVVSEASVEEEERRATESGDRFVRPRKSAFGRLYLKPPSPRKFAGGVVLSSGVDFRRALPNESPASREMTMVEPVFAFRPASWHSVLELRPALVLTRNERVDASGSRIAYFENRYRVGGLLLARPARGVYAGGGLSIGVTHPTLNADFDLGGGWHFDAAVILALGGFPWINNDIGFEGSIRTGWISTPRNDIPDAEGDPTNLYFPTFWFGGGVRFGKRL